jgi:[acyl-carrier-protein] S-malonyltransferase
MTRTAYLFPGQGSQHVGMAADLLRDNDAAREVFDRCERAVSLELRKLVLEGPEQQLSRTDVAQPAIFAVSAAVLAALRQMAGPEAEGVFAADSMAGLSLGEYTALYAAGCMDLETACRLVARRGRLMQQAAEARPSSMVSLMGLEEPQVRELCEKAAQGQVLSCANFNCPGQIVVSGETDACRRVLVLAEEFGARAVELKVAGAFHSELMAPAAEAFAEELARVDFQDPAVEVLSNVDAEPYRTADEIAPRLLRQLTHPVRWQQCMQRLLDAGCETYYEIGPGKVLAGLMRRIDRKTRVTVLNDLPSLQKAVSPAT